MTSAILAIVLTIAGAVLLSSKRLVLLMLGAFMFTLGVGLWFGLNLVCGTGPLAQCGLFQ